MEKIPQPGGTPRIQEEGILRRTRLSVSSMPVKFLLYYIVRRSPEGPRPRFGERIDP